MPKKSKKDNETYQVHIEHRNKIKAIKLKPHHRKPYRKRHFATLFVFLILITLLIIFGATYEQKSLKDAGSTKAFISNLFKNNESQYKTIKSTHGFSLKYDSNKFYGVGIDSATGNIFTSKELSTDRPYRTIKIATLLPSSEDNISTMTVNYDTDSDANKITEAESKLSQDGIDTTASKLEKVSSEEKKIDGISFTKSEWKLTPNNVSFSKVVSKYITYVGVLNNKIITIKVAPGFSDNNNLFDSVIESIKFGNSTEKVSRATISLQQKINYNQNLLNTFTFTSVAQAAAKEAEVSSTELDSAKYSPAVVKIYNLYCLDININNTPYLNNVCQGLTGSGFVVSSDGYVATNGHVARVSAKELAIYQAIYTLSKGDTRNVLFLGNLAGIQDSDLDGLTKPEDIISRIVDKLYSIPDSTFSTPNSITNLLVGLNNTTPDVQALVQLTKDRKSFTETNNIRVATVSAFDFRLIDGINSFKASDVAILKINNKNLPVTKLGAIDSITQGSSLAILGYPGSASTNGLVNEEQSKVTLTSGKVSSIKNAKGSTKKLIETDTTIGSGNSGGPALDEKGNVIGLATYTVDESGSGGGVFNYIRDIKDLKDLASSASIKFNTTSQTQTEWEKGLKYFYDSRYSKAVKSFEKVKDLYPEHSKVAEFTSVAEARIKNGQDVKDFPYWLVAIALFILLIGVGVTLFLILRHRKKHELYNEHVINGSLPPMGTPATGPLPSVTNFNSVPPAAQTPVTSFNPAPPAPQPPVAPPVAAPPTPPVAPSNPLNFPPAQNDTAPIIDAYQAPADTTTPTNNQPPQ